MAVTIITVYYMLTGLSITYSKLHISLLFFVSEEKSELNKSFLGIMFSHAVSL